MAKTKDDDKRPDPKPRKHPQLWQAYQWWYTLMETRKRYKLRVSSIERGKSSMDAVFEKNMAQELGVAYLKEEKEAGNLSIKKMENAIQNETAIDVLVEHTKKTMINYGRQVPIWEFVTGIKGLGESGLSAQLIAQIDDIERFPTVSALWRFCGLAVIEGKAEGRTKGEVAHFNGKLKGICFNIQDQFVRQQTPGYIEIYYAEKARQRELHPEPVKVEDSNKILYTADHLNTRSWRKMVKAFLRDLWVEWKRLNREAEAA